MFSRYIQSNPGHGPAPGPAPGPAAFSLATDATGKEVTPRRAYNYAPSSYDYTPLHSFSENPPQMTPYMNAFEAPYNNIYTGNGRVNCGAYTKNHYETQQQYQQVVGGCGGVGVGVDYNMVTPNNIGFAPQLPFFQQLHQNHAQSTDKSVEENFRGEMLPRQAKVQVIEEDSDNKKEKSTTLSNWVVEDSVRIQDKENQGDSTVKMKEPTDQDATANRKMPSKFKNKENISPYPKQKPDISSELSNKSSIDKHQLLYSYGMRFLTGNVENVLKWHKALADLKINTMYEVFGKCLSIRSGKGCEKHLLVRDTQGPVLQAVFYEIDFMLPNMQTGNTIRLVGIMVGSNKMKAFKIREVLPFEMSVVPRLTAITQHIVTKILNASSLDDTFGSIGTKEVKTTIRFK